METRIVTKSSGPRRAVISAADEESGREGGRQSDIRRERCIVTPGTKTIAVFLFPPTSPFLLLMLSRHDGPEMCRTAEPAGELKRSAV